MNKKFWGDSSPLLKVTIDNSAASARNFSGGNSSIFYFSNRAHHDDDGDACQLPFCFTVKSFPPNVFHVNCVSESLALITIYVLNYSKRKTIR